MESSKITNSHQAYKQALTTPIRHTQIAMGNITSNQILKRFGKYLLR